MAADWASPARAEYYSDFGSTLDGKLTVRVQPHPTFVLRGSVSTGFRAPSLGQSFFSSTATNFLNLGQGLVPVESLTLPVDSAPAQALGAAAAEAGELADTSAPASSSRRCRSFEIAVDYYRIAIDDRIVLSGNFTAAPIAALLAPFGANSARFFTNAIDTRTNGVDVTASYRIALDIGRQPAPARRLQQHAHRRSSGRSQRRRNWRRSRRSCSIASSGVGSSAVSRSDSLRLGGDWRRTGSASTSTRREYGEFCSFTLNPSDDQEYAAKWLTDVEASYRAGGYTLAIGVQNLFDVFPDRNTTVNSFNGIQTFPSHSPFGMNGRALYARIGWNF